VGMALFLMGRRREEERTAASSVARSRWPAAARLPWARLVNKKNSFGNYFY
jgi:hypothetical protein